MVRPTMKGLEEKIRIMQRQMKSAIIIGAAVIGILVVWQAFIRFHDFDQDYEIHATIDQVNQLIDAHNVMVDAVSNNREGIIGLLMIQTGQANITAIGMDDTIDVNISCGVVQ